MCRRIAAAAADSYSSDGRKPLVECRSLNGRGRSLIAILPIHVGCHPLSTPTKEDGLCEPIAHPVLIESMRSTRCSFCFQPIYNNMPTSTSNASSTLHHHCSPQCQRFDNTWMLETQAAQKLPSPPSPTAISCSRILRKFQESPSALEKYNQLCWNVDLLSQQDKDAYLTILTQCHIFLCAMGQTAAAKMTDDLIHPDPTSAFQFMSRLSMNGFTITNSELLPIGHGVYCGASMINHSCRPNAVPTFWLRTSIPPMLQITACQSINIGEEVTISYCETSTPKSIRTECLWKSYKFVCDCPLCKDVTKDDDLVGLKCATEGCKGRVRSISTVAESASLGEEGSNEKEKTRHSYQCDSCGNTSFEAALKVQADSMEKMKQLESIMTNCNTLHKEVGEESLQIYELLKRHCDLKQSYYIAWSADLFVSFCANALKFCANEEERMSLCHKALVVLNESRSATKFCMEYVGNLSWHIKRGTEAKLRLFVNPMDLEALGMLRNVKEEMLVFFPSNDDIILSLDESIAAYSFS